MGRSSLTLPPDGPIAEADIEVVWPDLSGPLADYPSRAGAGPRFTGGARSDSSSKWPRARRWRSWSTTRRAGRRSARRCRSFCDRLHAAGVGREDVTISVGVGRHHAVDAEAMRRRLGDSIAAGYRCFSPPVDDLSAYVDLGSTPRGIPVRVFRPVAEAEPADPGRLGAAASPGRFRRRLQADLSGHEPPYDAGSAASPGAGGPVRRGRLAGGPCRWSTRCGKRSTTRPSGSGRAGRSATWSVVRDRSSEWLPGIPSACRISWRPRRVGGSRHRRSAPADLIVAGNHPWPGDPMQSFKVLLHHRAACRPGGVLVGLFWTDPAEIDRSFPIAALRRIAATGALGGWTIRRLLPVAQRIAAASGSPAAFMLRWARELVVDRTVLVYAPPLCERVGPRLGPVRLFADQAALWRARPKRPSIAAAEPDWSASASVSFPKEG